MKGTEDVPGVDPNPMATADLARAELASALEAANITLPSLALDHASIQHGVMLVELGRARPDVVRALAAVVRQGGKAEPWRTER